MYSILPIDIAVWNQQQQQQQKKNHKHHTKGYNFDPETTDSLDDGVSVF